VLLSGWCLIGAPVASAAEAPSAPGVPDFYSTEVQRFHALLSRKAAEFRLDGIEGLSWLRHWQSEEALLRLTGDEDPLVRREAVSALTRFGTARSIPRLLELLTDERHEIAQLSHLGLQRMTAQGFARDRPAEWRQWWEATNRSAKVGALLDQVRDPATRAAALTALRHLSEPEDEPRFLQLLTTPQQPPFGGAEWTLGFEVLERIGGEQSLPYLLKAASLAPAAYALGRLGGPQAEEALLAARKSEAVWVNLDRLHSRRCAPFAAELLNSFGLLSYRSMPDDVYLEPQPIQHVAANLLLRTDKAPALVDLLLCELEGKSKADSAPEPLKQLLLGMRPELRPGFVRDDGEAQSRALAALPHVTKDRQFIPRLIALLDHPAIVPRVYAALTLGFMHAEEAVAPLLRKIEEPYPFPDATTRVSGKHFEHSQNVRWKGFFCMALGRLGTDSARVALEQLATTDEAPRDVRYGAVVGLGFVGSGQSLPVLKQLAERDPIWMVRETASAAVADAELRQKEAAAQ
jgi:HEAT repeat protein